MKSIAIAALLGHISAEDLAQEVAQELLKDIMGETTLPVAPEDDTLFNPAEETLEDLNKPEPTTPCCNDCSEPLEKYYSVDKLHGNCGEACMDPKKYWLYKIFEPALAKDDSTNTPCFDRGFDDYQYTPTHGAGPVKMTLDLYGPHKNEGFFFDTEALIDGLFYEAEAFIEEIEGIFQDTQGDCEKLSAEDQCHTDKKCSWCKSAAVASKCNSVDTAKTLPSAVFQCDNLSMLKALGCDAQCKDTCCRNGGGAACISACGCSGACPSENKAFEDQADECEGLSAQNDCDAKDDCSWCKSAAVKSACKTLEVAKTLPSAVFQCDKLEDTLF